MKARIVPALLALSILVPADQSAIAKRLTDVQYTTGGAARLDADLEQRFVLLPTNCKTSII